MSPTSYQAAPPRTTNIADANDSVKRPTVAFKICCNDLFSAKGPIGYHSLYGVPSNCETRGEFECTLTIPVLD
jgi:hypothetical protein